MWQNLGTHKLGKMYYSSESSDSENTDETVCLDYSYSRLDAESLGAYLRNDIKEQLREISSNPNKSSLSFRGTQVLQKQLMVVGNAVVKSLHTDDDKLGDYSCNKKFEELSTVEAGCKSRPYERIIDTSCMSKNCIKESAANLIQDAITEKMYLQHNVLFTVPLELIMFSKIKLLDLSNNNLTFINDFVFQLPELQRLIVHNNALSDHSLPKDLSSLRKIKELNLSGNFLTKIPPQVYKLSSLRYLYLGNNTITEIPPGIKTLRSLQVLHLGGNKLESVPEELSELSHLGALILCENLLRSLPRAISRLHRLRTLLLHCNNLYYLPVEVVKLRSLNELSLRDNPLVTHFVNSHVQEIMYNPPSLLELAARIIRLKDIHYKPYELPETLQTYLRSARRCVNPKCKGVYFTSCIEHIKFVDFCGIYRVPLMHYICSSRCNSEAPAYYRSGSESDSEDDLPAARMKRVLLG